MFNITSKYFSIFNNKKPPAIWVMHIKIDFLTYSSCLYYSSMVFHQAWYCLLWTGGWGRFLLNRQNLLSVTEVICWWSLDDFFFCPLSNLDIFYFMMRWPLKEAEHSQKLITYLFQNDVALYFEPLKTK